MRSEVGAGVPQRWPPLILPAVKPVDLTDSNTEAERAAAEWGLELGVAFTLSRYSYVASAGDGDMIGEELKWDDGQEGKDGLQRAGHVDDLIDLTGNSLGTEMPITVLEIRAIGARSSSL